eukprot:GFYU01012389.1.p1 GENE.GFYU01012389.1~~GFYU01012389.1.p1  ORF type:complete len:363 (-),score=71.60 GFYU01012389.1:77-1036(-)
MVLPTGEEPRRKKSRKHRKGILSDDDTASESEAEKQYVLPKPAEMHIIDQTHSIQPLAYVTKLVEGEMWAGNRSKYAIRNLAAKFVGAERLFFKKNTVPSPIKFRIRRSAEVYVALDHIHKMKVPDDWLPSGEKLQVEVKGTLVEFELYTKTFSKGSVFLPFESEVADKTTTTVLCVPNEKPLIEHIDQDADIIPPAFVHALKEDESWAGNRTHYKICKIPEKFLGCERLYFIQSKLDGAIQFTLSKPADVYVVDDRRNVLTLPEDFALTEYQVSIDMKLSKVPQQIFMKSFGAGPVAIPCSFKYNDGSTTVFILPPGT